MRVPAAVAPPVSFDHEVCYGIGSDLRGMQPLLLSVNRNSNLSNTRNSVLVYVNLMLEMSKESKQLSDACMLQSESFHLGLGGGALLNFPS